MPKIISGPSDQSLERKFLGGLIHNGVDVWIDICDFIKEEDFTNSGVKMLFKVCRLLLEENKTLDSAIISSRCKSQGITISEGNVGDFIENLLISPLNVKSSVEAAQELIMLRIRRNKIANARDIAKFSQDFEGTNLSDFANGAEEIFADGNDIILDKHEPVNIAQSAYEIVEELGNNDGEYVIKTPWPTFNAAFSGFRPKDSYCIAGRPSHGKSGVLLSRAQFCANEVEDNFIDGKRLPVLYLDTEMDAKEQTLRWAAMVADIDPFLVESGDWRKNKDCVEKIRTVLKDKSSTDNFHHVYVPGLSAMEIRSIFRRWVRKTCGRDNVGIVVFDYLKITGEELKGASNPRLEMGYKLDMLKDEIKDNSNCTFLFGAQRNRYGEDDDSSIAESDYIQQLSTWTGLIKKKSMAELAEQPADEFGTHMLIPTKFRKLGRDGQNFENPVKIEGKYLRNWINLDFSNFRFNDKDDGRAVQDYLSLVASNNGNNNRRQIP